MNHVSFQNVFRFDDDGVLSQIYSCQYAVFTPKAFNRSQVYIKWHTLRSVITDGAR